MFQKVSRLKLSLPRQKWTMNKTLIFFKSCSVFPKYWNWICIYQYRSKQWNVRFIQKVLRLKVYLPAENEPWTKGYFFSECKLCSKCIVIKFVKQKWTRNEVFIFFKIVPSTFSVQCGKTSYETTSSKALTSYFF